MIWSTVPCPMLYNWFFTDKHLVTIVPCPMLYTWFFTDNHLINIRLYLT